jgi:hypothetical protein
LSSVIGLAGDPARPVSVLIDTAKSRVLRFALEIREALAAVDDELGKLPTAKIDAAVNTFIIGGNNVINSQVAQLSQQGNTTIVQGDFGALAKALEALGIAESDIADLKRATDEDAAKPESGLGKKTSSWLSKLAAKMGGAGWTVGTAAGVEIVTPLILKYLGGLAISANACAPRSDRVGLTTSGESELEKADDVASAVRRGFGLMTFGTTL